MAVDKAVEEIKKASKACKWKEDIARVAAISADEESW